MIRPTRSYIVAATPRTGSSLLCEALRATQIAGRPDEVFAPAFRSLWLDALRLPADASFEEYFDTAIQHGTTTNGIYAMKIQAMHIAVLANDIGFAGPPEDVLDSLFPGAQYVNMVRRDRESQARSWFRAIRTNEWWRFEGEVRPRAPEPAPEPGTIRELEEHIEHQQSQWEQYFRSRGAQALRVEYEDLAAARREETGRVLSFLGLDPTAATRIPPPFLTRQSIQEDSSDAEVAAQHRRG